MIKEQTKTLAGRYVAPQMGEHMLTVRGRILQDSICTDPVGTVEDFGNPIDE